MGSTFDTGKADTNSDEARFLAKAGRALDSSLTYLPQGIEARLDSARHAAMLQAQELGSADSAADRGRAAAFDAGEQQMPESVRVRLDAIRAGAMLRAGAAQLKRHGAHKANSGWWTRWVPQGFAVPASAFASICMLVTTLAILNLSESPETMPLVVAENYLVLASEEEIELYENLEFYQWLADNGL